MEFPMRMLCTAEFWLCKSKMCDEKNAFGERHRATRTIGAGAQHRSGAVNFRNQEPERSMMQACWLVRANATTGGGE
jgi:hypothetical protein